MPESGYIKTLHYTLRRLDGLPNASSVAASLRDAFAKHPLKFLIVCVDTHSAIWADDSVTATKLLAEPSDLLLEIAAASRAADLQKIRILVHEALAPDLVALSG